MDLEMIILNQVSKAGKDKYHDITSMCNLIKNDAKNLLTKQKQAQKIPNQTMITKGQMWGGTKLGGWD